ncbi:hypothetical protein SADUNF_Sadunf12G0070300 [Salix dunnii]|uniref:Uncharacterized protein n=1 Tax=Salix dunnii TaxID=1413687 RepID=A0A835JM07_9ROSI|nr:hypothetical protein SADUNF_Sadunf12G0070300 [Salix dunnii]
MILLLDYPFNEERKEFIASLHKRKTELFMALIEKKLLPLRPGVAKCFANFSMAKLKILISGLRDISFLLGAERAEQINIFAGDVVPRKKPDPLCSGGGQCKRSCSSQSCWNEACSNEERLLILTALDLDTDSAFIMLDLAASSNESASRALLKQYLASSHRPSATNTRPRLLKAGA